MIFEFFFNFEKTLFGSFYFFNFLKFLELFGNL